MRSGLKNDALVNPDTKHIQMWICEIIIVFEMEMLAQYSVNTVCKHLVAIIYPTQRDICFELIKKSATKQQVWFSTGLQLLSNVHFNFGSLPTDSHRMDVVTPKPVSEMHVQIDQFMDYLFRSFH